MPPRLTRLPPTLAQYLHLSLRSHSTHHPSPSSVSASEVSHFSALASSWWDPHGPSALLHAMNPLRHTFIRHCLTSATTEPASRQFRPPPPSSTPHHKQGTTYLDIGCGGGIFAESAARLAGTERVTGVDPTPDVLRVAKAHLASDPPLAASGKLSYLEGSVETLLPADLQADIVSVFEVVEHVNRPSDFLTACMAHVRPGGWLVGSTIARTWTSWLTTKVMAEEVLRIVPRGTHDWEKYIQPEEMRDWAGKQEGWGEWRVMGVVYVPGMGWREVKGSEGWGNYFFGMRRLV
ncbi:ubiquinone biosynthesis O-methyltransferase [Myriangium duriaei CBS 260.36]|uniref:Ubiquinone biosynthesis O-methyltransferase, mitochondrial n=1 Tax=Myriangium duriaei CBS 260.36 TaxID=1168546 RepID=A0A9P4J2H0_9PEZI|nr:ubiquinone biosynthesis O-methyltransferase [Myriangium duriaei CBS 260.36]